MTTDQAAAPLTLKEALARLAAQMELVQRQMTTIPANQRLPGRIYLEATPAAEHDRAERALVALFEDEAGAALVGARGTRGGDRRLFLVVPDDGVVQLVQRAPAWASPHSRGPHVVTGVRSLARIALPDPATVARNPADIGAGQAAWEVALQPDGTGRLDEASLAIWYAFVEACGAVPVVRYTRAVGTLTYAPVQATGDQVRTLARFNAVRSIALMPRVGLR